jgi:GAF domain-containing protein
MLENATRICEAKFGTLYRYDGGAFYPVTFHKVPSSLADFLRQRGSFVPPAGTPLDRLLRTRNVSHIVDDDSADPVPGAAATHGGARVRLAVPMLKDNELVGAILIYRQEVRPFTDKQIELVQNFAAQAVIAIENTRLLNELRQRTDDLSESLEQQTATSEVLQTISSSQGELQPVFDSLLANATRLCVAKYGTLFLCEGDDLRVVAQHNTLAALAEQRRRDPILRPGANTAIRRSTKTKQVVQIADIVAEPAYSERDPAQVAAVELGGYRAVLSVPMLKDNEVVGAINIYRQETGAFDDKQVELVKNFAAQAVIAIENARLLNELRQRTDDLSESLEQQTATSEVLQVISRSPGQLEPVFKAMLENAVRICEAKFGTMFLREGDAFRTVALHNAPPAYAELRRRDPVIHPHQQSALLRLVATRQVVHIADIRLDQGYLAGARNLVAIAETAGARTLLVVCRC